MTSAAVVVVSHLLAGWALLAFAAAVASRIWEAAPSLSPFVSALVAAILFAGGFFIPLALSARSVYLANIVVVWLVLAPWISLALVMTGAILLVRMGPAPNLMRTKNGDLVLNGIVTLLVLFNSVWLTKLDAAALSQ